MKNLTSGIFGVLLKVLFGNLVIIMILVFFLQLAHCPDNNNHLITVVIHQGSPAQLFPSNTKLNLQLNTLLAQYVLLQLVQLDGPVHGI